MNKLITLIIVINALFFNNAFADDVCKKDFNTMYCKEGTVDKINFFGNVNLSGTTVLNKTYVFGNLDSENAQLNSVKVTGDFIARSSAIHQWLSAMGDVNATGLTISGETDILGNFTGNNFKSTSPVKIIGVSYCKDCVFGAATKLIGDVTVLNTKFDATLEVVTLNSSFTHSTLKDIFIKNSNKETSQTISLNDRTEAHDITFENQKGIVMLSSNSKITGTVKGGIVKPLLK